MNFHKKIALVVSLSFVFSLSFAGKLKSHRAACKPCKVNIGCKLSGVKNDKLLRQILIFSKDPGGLSAIAKPNVTDARVFKAFNRYGVKHKCQIYSMSLDDLVKGLIKDFDAGDMNQSGSAKKEPKKYMLMDPDKAECMKKLDLKLPVKIYGVKSK